MLTMFNRYVNYPCRVIHSTLCFICVRPFVRPSIWCQQF